MSETPHIIDKARVETNFSRHACSYDAVSPVQRQMGLRLLDGTLALLRRPVAHVLELGCGTGRLTEQLCRRWPGARVLANDISPAMIALAAARLSPGADVLFRAGDAEQLWRTLDGEVAFDLIIANAAVQWFDDAPLALRRYAARLAPGGVIACSTFGPETFTELRAALHEAEARGESARRRPRLLSFITAGEWRRRLAACAGVSVSVVERRRQIGYASVDAFLDTVRRAGAANARMDRRPLSRAAYERMKAVYTRQFAATSGGVVATYHEIYIAVRRDGE